jgi:hypothetical protein
MGIQVVGDDMAVTSPRSVLDLPFVKDDEEPRVCETSKRKLLFDEPASCMNLRQRTVCDETVAWLAKDAASLSHKIEELWLGPVFESSQTVLTAISTLPTSVTHLDLDLRNALHLLPQAMPLLFSKTHLTTLSVRLFGDGGAMELAKWIHLNPKLQRLDLRGNRIGSEGARAIVDAILDCGHRLTYLNLSCNCILDGDGIALLLDSAHLESLDLGFNWMGDGDVQQICQALKQNKSLRELNLFGCQRISDVGIHAMLQCLQQYNTSLRTIQVQAFDGRAARIMDQIHYWLALNRSGRCLLKEDDDVPSGLWPLVFQKSNGQPDSLYYLLRQGGPRILYP